MSRYLDEASLPRLVAEHFDSRIPRESRLVGYDRSNESYYFDIIRFFGSAAVTPDAMKVVHRRGTFQLRDPKIRAFAQEIANQLRKESRLYDGPQVAKLAGIDRTALGATITIQPAEYADQTSCFALDLPHDLFAEHGGTLRQYYKSMYPSLLPEEHPLAVCFGVCGYLLLQEGGRWLLLQVRRSKKLASLEDSLGPTVAGSVEYASDYRTLADMLIRPMTREIHEEIGLTPGEYTLIPLAYAREILRGERPQLFSLITTTLSREQITTRLNAVAAESREHDAFFFLELSDKGRLPDQQVATLNLEARTNYYLIEEFLQSGAG